MCVIYMDGSAKDGTSYRCYLRSHSKKEIVYSGALRDAKRFKSTRKAREVVRNLSKFRSGLMIMEVME